jgi:hypothetical protein
MAKTKINWDSLEGPYKKFYEALLDADEPWRLANRFVLDDSSLAPQSCIDIWLCPNGKIIAVQRWEDGGFQHYRPFDGHKMDDVIAETIEFGKRATIASLPIEDTGTTFADLLSDH